MTLAPTELTASTQDIDGVTTAALDYIEGYVDGDAQRHARAYHPECVKRRYATDEESGVTELVVMSPQTMVDYAAQSVMPMRLRRVAPGENPSALFDRAGIHW